MVPKTIVVVRVNTRRAMATIQARTWRGAAGQFARLMQAHHPLLETYGVDQIRPNVAVVTVGPKSKRNPGLCCLPGGLPV
jgi:hypothetical protein